jgi:protein TBF1
VLTAVQSIQILSTLTQGHWLATLKVVQAPQSELGQAYATLKSLFDQTKQIYSQNRAFLSADELNIHETEHRATIRITNLATFISSVFGGSIGFYELNDHFIETFAPDGEPMSKEAGDLFLGLKTQMFLSAVTQEEQERAKEDILEDFFPVGLDELLLSRHPTVELAESENEFLRASQERRHFLMMEANNIESIRKCKTPILEHDLIHAEEISSKFAWEDFLQSLCAHLSKTYGPLITPYMKRHALTAPASPVRGANQNATQSTENSVPSFEEVVKRAEQATMDAFLPRSANKHTENHEGKCASLY